MPRLIYVFAFLVALGVGLFSSSELRTQAANPPPALAAQPNTDQFMYNGKSLDLFNAAGGQLRQTGVWYWRYVNLNGCGGDLRPAILEALSNAQSNLGIRFIEDAAGSSGQAHLLYGNCGSAFTSICGAGAAACLGRGYPYDVTIDFNAPTISTYFFVTQVSIVLHELVGHAQATMNEQYSLSGCLCANPGWHDFMNTGADSRHEIEAIEQARWQRTMGTPELTTFGSGRNGAGFYLFACNIDPKATDLSVLYEDGWGRYWSGVAVPVKRDANGCQGVGQLEGVQAWPGVCFYLKQENAASWATNINEVRVTCL